METYLSLTISLYVIERKDYRQIDQVLQTKCMKGVITSLYNPVPAATCSGLIVYLLASHWAPPTLYPFCCLGYMQEALPAPKYVS